MQWSDIGKLVGTVAPTVGTLLGGPAGAAVGALVASALGTSNDPVSVSAALASDPAALAAVQQAEINSKVQLQQLTVTAEQARLSAAQAQYDAEVKDRDSARTLAAAQPKDWIRPTIVVILLLGAIALAIAVFFMPETLPQATVLTIGTIIGFWFNELKQVLGFYFGSTKNASDTAAAITQFAVADGTVTSSK